MNPTIQSIHEHALIARLRRRAGAMPAWVHVGIGDDAAIVEPERGTLDVITTDSLVEGVHFRRDWTAPFAIGHRALAVNLSDLAAMGAAPRAVLLSLVLPGSFPLADFDALVDGFVTLAERERVPLVGGNLARSPGPVVIDVTAIGAVRARRVMTRAGRPGAALYVTRTVGAAAAGLSHLSAGRSRRARPDAAMHRALQRPEARLRCGKSRGTARPPPPSTCRFADAARQLAAASRSGVALDAERRGASGARQAAARGLDPSRSLRRREDTSCCLPSANASTPTS